MPAKADRLAERAHELFTVRTGTEVFSNFFTDGRRKVLVDIRGKAAQYLQAPGPGMSVVGERCTATSHHGVRPRSLNH